MVWLLIGFVFGCAVFWAWFVFRAKRPLTNGKRYKYKTIIGRVGLRELRDGESHAVYYTAPCEDIFVVDDPAPPAGDGWELDKTTFAEGKGGPIFVARDWRRALPTT